MNKLFANKRLSFSEKALVHSFFQRTAMYDLVIPRKRSLLMLHPGNSRFISA
jgi:hypothetical protein